MLHKTHVPLKKWFFAFYFVCYDKRGISAVQLAAILGTTYRTAWYMLTRIRIAMGCRDASHQLSGTVEFDDAYFGGPTVGQKRGCGTEKTRVFVELSLSVRGNPHFLKMQVTQDIKKETVKEFSQRAFEPGCTIRSGGYGSYIPALESFTHKIVINNNAKVFILGTDHPPTACQKHL